MRSVVIALRRLGADARSRRPDDVAGADLAVLPGVGSAALGDGGAAPQRGSTRRCASASPAGGPMLGICLGLQLALEESEEDGGVDGLGILPGRAVRLARAACRGSAGRGRAGGEAYYFAHSYAAETPCRDGVVRRASSPRRARGAFLGVQFHPEKSGAAGARYPGCGSDASPAPDPVPRRGRRPRRQGRAASRGCATSATRSSSARRTRTAARTSSSSST